MFIEECLKGANQTVAVCLILKFNRALYHALAQCNIWLCFESTAIALKIVISFAVNSFISSVGSRAGIREHDFIEIV
jgi:hypothetical protein